MIRPVLTYDIDELNILRVEAETLPQRFQANLDKRQPRIRTRVMSIVAIEPGPPSYPLRWTSEKQRRFVMAKLAREGNLPYTRSQVLLASYNVEITPSAPGQGQITLINDDPSSVFVVGEFQQPFHRDTGWIQVDTVTDELGVVVLDEVEQTFDETVLEGL